MTPYSIAFITVPDEETAVKIAQTLIEKKLAPCVNLIPALRSIYMWEGKLCDDKELLLIVKTKTTLQEELKSTVESIHPYDVPEVIFIDIQDGLPSYLNWIDENVKS